MFKPMIHMAVPLLMASLGTAVHAQESKESQSSLCAECNLTQQSESTKQTVYGPTGVKLFQVYLKEACIEPNTFIAHPITSKGQSLIYATEILVVKQELDDLKKRRTYIQDNYEQYVKRLKDDGNNRANHEISDLNFAILTRQKELKILVGQVYTASERAKTQTASLKEKMELTPVVFESWPNFQSRAREFAKPLQDFKIVCDRPTKRKSIIDLEPRVVINAPAGAPVEGPQATPATK